MDVPEDRCKHCCVWLAARPTWPCPRDSSPSLQVHLVGGRSAGSAAAVCLPHGVLYSLCRQGQVRQHVPAPGACTSRSCCCCSPALAADTHTSVLQSLGISAELKQAGYGLMCVGYAQSDLELETVDEDEVYDLQFGKVFAEQAINPADRRFVSRDDFAIELAGMDE